MFYTLEPHLGAIEKKLANETLNKNIISTFGNNVEKFEKSFSKFTKFNYTTAMNSGTSSLHLGLKANNVCDNDLVIIPSYTFAATANAIIYCGAKPWFHDINSENMMLDLDQVASSLEKKTYKKGNFYYHHKTKQKITCIVPVMTFGYSLNISKLLALKKKYNINILIDSAAGHFASYDKKKLGFYNFDCCYSFNGNKNISTSSGGAFCTNNFKRNLIVKKLSKVGRISKYNYQLVGYNYRMNNLQASLGNGQLKNVKKFLRNKKEIFSFYSKSFENFFYIKKIILEDFNNIEGWLFAVKLNPKKLNKIINFLKTKKIFLSKFWYPLHKQPPYKNFLRENLNSTIKESGKILCLPSSTFLQKKDLRYIVDRVKDFF